MAAAANVRKWLEPRRKSASKIRSANHRSRPQSGRAETHIELVVGLEIGPNHRLDSPSSSSSPPSSYSYRFLNISSFQSLTSFNFFIQFVLLFFKICYLKMTQCAEICDAIRSIRLYFFSHNQQQQC